MCKEKRRLWVRLHEKGGKRHEMPCHHNLESYLRCLSGWQRHSAGSKGTALRTIGGNTGLIEPKPYPPANAYAMINVGKPLRLALRRALAIIPTERPASRPI